MWRDWPHRVAALKGATGGLHDYIDYQAGLSVIVDRQSGAQGELLAAPIPRSLIVLGNLAVALVLATLQVSVLVGVAAVCGADFQITATLALLPPIAQSGSLRTEGQESA